MAIYILTENMTDSDLAQHSNDHLILTNNMKVNKNDISNCLELADGLMIKRNSKLSEFDERVFIKAIDMNLELVYC